MRVFIAGGTGLIGRYLAKDLLAAGHQPVILSRHADAVRRDRTMWPYRSSRAIRPSRASGRRRSTAATRSSTWPVTTSSPNAGTPKIKHKIRDSRVHSAENLVAAIKNATSRPKVFVQGSAIGFYGPQGDEELDRVEPVRHRFPGGRLPGVRGGRRHSIEPLGVRRAIVRTGIVLAPGAGALKIMTPIFKLGPGTPIGSGGGLLAKGDQWMSWIHIDDIVGIFSLGVENDGASGPVNGTAPEPGAQRRIRQDVFRRAQEAATRRGGFIVPVRAARTQCSGSCWAKWPSVITTGQKVLPSEGAGPGLCFKYPHLAEALRGRRHAGATAARVAPPAAGRAHH